MTAEPQGPRIPLSAPDIGEAEIAAVVDVLRGGRLALGPRLTAFERAAAACADARHAVAVSSGTAGLHLAVRALGLGRGDEVITTPLSFIASANAIRYEGARPVFADVDRQTLNLDPERVEAAITPRTRAILVVHLFGRPAPMGALLALAAQHGLAVIEDACEAIGAAIDGRPVGALGDAGVFGFYPNKQITTGEGGVVVTDRAELATRIASLRNHGRPGAGALALDHAELGFNYRLSELQCALGEVQLNRLPAILSRRAEVARAYTRKLAGSPELILPGESEGERVSWFVYVVRLTEHFSPADRDRIAEGLVARGIGCGRYFPPIHLQRAYDEFGHRAGDFPEAERAAARTLALPFFNRIADEQIDEVVRTLLELVARS